jgi:hypothetical protein
MMPQSISLKNITSALQKTVKKTTRKMTRKDDKERQQEEELHLFKLELSYG